MPHDARQLPPFAIVVPDDDEMEIVPDEAETPVAETPPEPPPEEPETIDEDAIADAAPDIIAIFTQGVVDRAETPRRSSLRIVAIGGLDSVLDGPDLSAFFSQRVEARVFPATDLFEAGIYAAGADAVLIDLNGRQFDETVTLVRTCRKLIPRASLFAIREPRSPASSIPSSLGVALSFACGTPADAVARGIEETIHGPIDGDT